jgi:hypothetical protein
MERAKLDVKVLDAEGTALLSALWADEPGADGWSDRSGGPAHNTRAREGVQNSWPHGAVSRQGCSTFQNDVEVGGLSRAEAAAEIGAACVRSHGIPVEGGLPTCSPLAAGKCAMLPIRAMQENNLDLSVRSPYAAATQPFRPALPLNRSGWASTSSGTTRQDAPSSHGATGLVSAASGSCVLPPILATSRPALPRPRSGGAASGHPRPLHSRPCWPQPPDPGSLFGLQQEVDARGAEFAVSQLHVQMCQRLVNDSEDSIRCARRFLAATHGFVGTKVERRKRRIPSQLFSTSVSRTMLNSRSLEAEVRRLAVAHPPELRRLRQVETWLTERRGALGQQRGLLQAKQLVCAVGRGVGRKAPSHGVCSVWVCWVALLIREENALIQLAVMSS